MNQVPPARTIPLPAVDALLLEKYLQGRFRDPEDDPGRIRRMKDVGYLSCTLDMETGEEFLTTTPSGEFEVCLNNCTPREKIHRMLASMLNAEGYW